MIIDIEVLEEYGEVEKLGNPVALEVVKIEDSSTASAPAPQAQPAAISGNQFYGNKPQQQQQQQAPQRQLPTRASGASGPQSGNIYPIEALSPYQGKWTIKARCSHKGPIKTWHNKNGEGKLFSVNFIDESGEIKATAFKEAVDQWYDVLQEDAVYYVSSCRVQLAKKQFSNVNHDYELTFERDTHIEKVRHAAIICLPKTNSYRRPKTTRVCLKSAITSRLLPIYRASRKTRLSILLAFSRRSARSLR